MSAKAAPSATSEEMTDAATLGKCLAMLIKDFDSLVAEKESSPPSEDFDALISEEKLKLCPPSGDNSVAPEAPREKYPPMQDPLYGIGREPTEKEKNQQKIVARLLAMTPDDDFQECRLCGKHVKTGTRCCGLYAFPA